MSAPRPLSVLIAALGGEGGGVLSQWIVAAALAEGLAVQSTSIPGVAQRTGATTYYIEMLPARTEEDQTPIFALAPFPGGIDVLVSSELLEAARAMQNGFVTPERTTLIASIHRQYAIGERTAMGDGRYDAGRVLDTAAELAKRAVLFDMSQATEESGSVISAVLLGAIAGAGVLPLDRERFEQTIRDSGLAVEANLKGFAAGFKAAAAAHGVPRLDEPAKRPQQGSHRAAALLDRVEADYPKSTWPVVKEGVSRLAGYQDAAYARLYLDRLDTIRALDAEAGSAAESHKLTSETGRYLATWMAYDDIIRVGDLKTRKGRLERVAAEVRATPDQPVIVTDHFKPGIEEICAILPPGLARPILRWAKRRGAIGRLHIGLHIKTTSVSGFLLVWLLARLKGFRRMSSRFADEQALIERWLAAVRGAAAHDADLAREVVECARLIKGYGETHRRGRGNFLSLIDGVVLPALTYPGTAESVRRAREAALADPDGDAFEKSLAEILAQPGKEPEPEAEPEAQRAAGE